MQFEGLGFSPIGMYRGIVEPLEKCLLGPDVVFENVCDKHYLIKKSTLITRQDHGSNYLKNLMSTLKAS